MGEHAESMVKNKNTLSEVREVIKLNPEFGSAFKDSMSAPILAVSRL